MAQQSASKNNFYFWQLEIESIKDDPDRMATSVISQELTVRHLLHYIAVHPSLHDDQLPPDLRPPPPSRSGRGSGHQPDGERSKTGSGGVRDDAGPSVQHETKFNSIVLQEFIVRIMEFVGWFITTVLFKTE